MSAKKLWGLDVNGKADVDRGTFEVHLTGTMTLIKFFVILAVVTGLVVPLLWYGIRSQLPCNWFTHEDAPLRCLK